MEKVSRRQRLDEEYITLLDDDQKILCQYGPSLITDIFAIQTIIDATLFFIAGEHKKFRVTPNEIPDVLEASFLSPRIPTFFAPLLPSDEISTQSRQKSSEIIQRARKKCAFFTLQFSRARRMPNEPEIVQLRADVKLFHYTVHVCGLRDARDAELAMTIISHALTTSQERMNDPAVLEEMAAGDRLRRDFLQSNNRCCTETLTISLGDVVMTNICGKFPRTLSLRTTFHELQQRYPGVLSYLTTMSKSNYLAITLFEHEPFMPIRTREEIGDELEDLTLAKRTYLMSGKKVRSKIPKHTFFVYASGRFIQSSRNNTTALKFTDLCMRLLHAITADAIPPVVEDGESTTGTAPEESSDEEIEE